MGTSEILTSLTRWLPATVLAKKKKQITEYTGLFFVFFLGGVLPRASFFLFFIDRASRAFGRWP